MIACTLVKSLRQILSCVMDAAKRNTEGRTASKFRHFFIEAHLIVYNRYRSKYFQFHLLMLLLLVEFETKAGYMFSASGSEAGVPRRVPSTVRILTQ
jgi:hypothetical protein